MFYWRLLKTSKTTWITEIVSLTGVSLLVIID